MLPHWLSLITILLSGVVSACASYVASRFSQRQQQLGAIAAYKQALITEIRSLHGHLQRYEAAFDSRVLTRKMASAQLLKILLQPGDMIIFTSNTSSIGLLDRRTALRVLRFYAQIRTLQGHALVLSELAGEAGGAFEAAEIRRHQAMLRSARRRAHAVMKDLRRPTLQTLITARLFRRLRRIRSGFRRMRG